jgi:hypothetical protein
MNKRYPLLVLVLLAGVTNFSMANETEKEEGIAWSEKEGLSKTFINDDTVELVNAIERFPTEFVRLTSDSYSIRTITISTEKAPVDAEALDRSPTTRFTFEAVKPGPLGGQAVGTKKRVLELSGYTSQHRNADGGPMWNKPISREVN